ncbi:DUF1800 family protein [Thiorhodococcus mannitoliphagus]|uniref:DUF1800 family protein n=1 Tax=Thiorhodococcus mannitoliphagus TaxID=329406 RepID=UPI00197F01E9
MAPAERQARHKERRQKADTLRQWLFGEMRTTTSPLTERMTLFWHGHFASAFIQFGSPAVFRSSFRRTHWPSSFCRKRPRPGLESAT